MEVLAERYKPVPGELKDDDAMIVEYHDEHGNVTERHVGETSRQMFVAHEQNTCQAYCPYCYAEAETYLEKLRMSIK